MMTLTKKSTYKPLYLEAHNIPYESKQKCGICGKLLWTTHLTVHHLIPVHIDPSRALDVSNMILICTDCHKKFHPENEYLDRIASLQKEQRWYRQRIQAYKQQIKEMQKTNPSRYFEKYIETNKRIHTIYKYLCQNHIEIIIPKKWLADERMEI